MARYPRQFLSGHDTVYDTIDLLPTNADHGEVAYVASIAALCVYDASAAQTTPTAKNGSWKALTPIEVAGTPGTATGIGSVWRVAYAGCLAVDTTNHLLYQATAVSTTATWGKVGTQT